MILNNSSVSQQRAAALHKPGEAEWFLRNKSGLRRSSLALTLSPSPVADIFTPIVGDPPTAPPADARLYGVRKPCLRDHCWVAAVPTPPSPVATGEGGLGG